MRKVVQAGILAAFLFLAPSLYAQGTIVFHNRNLSAPSGGTYNAAILLPSEGRNAQLFLVTGSAGSETYTPVPGLQTFRSPPNNAFFVEPILVEVPGQSPGTTGLRFVVRAWGGNSYETADWRAQSALITVHRPLGGLDPAGGPPITPPDLGGPNGLQSFALIPEPRLFGAALLVAAGLLIRRRR